LETETRVALIGIIVEEKLAIDALNTLLHEYSPYIIGRMGLPYKQKNISIISVVVDAPQDIISTFSGKIGRLPGLTAKTSYAKMPEKES